MQSSAQPGAEPVQWPLRAARTYGLPVPPSPLIGRDADCQRATELIVSKRARLLTLVGPPGVGKTRLALGLAEQLQDHFEHGAAFLDLTSVREPTLVLGTLAETFGLRQQGNLSPADQLEGYLREMSVLLVLDNFEHLIAAGSEVARLLASAPGLVVLATSRAALRVRSERVYEVVPLPSEAGREMFIDRVQAVRPDFVCGAAETPIVDEICARLDGLPLALELAAGRSVLLSPMDIRDRLSRRLILLTDAPPDASSRHRTMRDAIDWSYELLPAEEQTLLRRLSVFVGGFTLQAAEAISQSATDAFEQRLQNLVRMSLVRVQSTSGGATATRFRLLETVREFAWEELLAAGEADAAELAHAEYWRQHVEAHYPLNFGPDQPTYHLRLEHELANLRRVLAWCVDSGHLDTALRLGGGLHWFWYGRGYLTEGLRVLTSALERGTHESPASRAVGARAAGALALNLGQFSTALGWLDLAINLGRARPLDDAARAELAMALGIRAVTLIAAGEYAAAEIAVRESLRLFEMLEDGWGVATAREVIGAIAALQGHAEAAEAFAGEALAFHRVHGSRENIARALDVLGYASALRGDLSQAEACFQESLGLRREGINRPAIAAVLARLGLVAYLGQHWQTAAGLYRESLALAQEVGDSAGVVRCLGQIAALALACGIDKREVARLGSAVKHHQGALRLPAPPVEQAAARRLTDVLRAEISPVGLATAWIGGRILDLADAARLGVSLLERITAAAAPGATAADSRLTPRESQVAVLIGQGLTNRQIAEQLVVAQRTVDTHVERILSKLDFATRSQVAAWVARHGLLPPGPNT